MMHLLACCRQIASSSPCAHWRGGWTGWHLLCLQPVVQFCWSPFLEILTTCRMPPCLSEIMQIVNEQVMTDKDGLQTACMASYLASFSLRAASSC